jgi:Fic-DOC domain mobile mystery protein B
MGLSLNYIDGQTPLSEEEKLGLRIKTITTRGELDELEQLNIEKALAWIFKSKFDEEKILTPEFICTVHKKMFGDVWEWAGAFRKTEKNIGVKWFTIGIELNKLIGDTRFWIENETYPPDEIAIRFKHRLVSIHCFSNGNGRHSRILADIIIESIYGREVFSWGNSLLLKPDAIRKEYIDSIRKLIMV